MGSPWPHSNIDLAPDSLDLDLGSQYCLGKCNVVLSHYVEAFALEVQMRSHRYAKVEIPSLAMSSEVSHPSNSQIHPIIHAFGYGNGFPCLLLGYASPVASRAGLEHATCASTSAAHCLNHSAAIVLHLETLPLAHTASCLRSSWLDPGALARVT